MQDDAQVFYAILYLQLLASELEVAGVVLFEFPREDNNFSFDKIDR